MVDKVSLGVSGHVAGSQTADMVQPLTNEVNGNDHDESLGHLVVKWID